jgi:hypothetical protein
MKARLKIVDDEKPEKNPPQLGRANVASFAAPAPSLGRPSVAPSRIVEDVVVPELPMPSKRATTRTRAGGSLSSDSDDPKKAERKSNPFSFSAFKPTASEPVKDSKDKDKKKPLSKAKQALVADLWSDEEDEEDDPFKELDEVKPAAAVVMEPPKKSSAPPPPPPVVALPAAAAAAAAAAAPLAAPVAARVPGSAADEVASLRAEVNDLRERLSRSRARQEAAEKALAALQASEREATRSLETMILSVEAKLMGETQRANSAEARARALEAEVARLMEVAQRGAAGAVGAEPLPREVAELQARLVTARGLSAACSDRVSALNAAAKSSFQELFKQAAQLRDITIMLKDFEKVTQL